jgi:hypothetical protein
MTEVEADSPASRYLNETIGHEEVDKVQDPAQHGAKDRTEVDGQHQGRIPIQKEAG